MKINLEFKYGLCVMLLILALPFPLQAQVVYECDFEQEAERNEWKLNCGANQALIALAENKWYIGSAGHNGQDGHYGLYMSNDGTNSTLTNTRATVMLAYRQLSLEEDKTYTLSYEWRGNTSVASGEGIYACLVPQSDASAKLNSGGQILPDWVAKYRLNEMVLGGSSTWQIHTSQVTTLMNMGTEYYLVFVWHQSGSKITTPPASCVDNIRMFGEIKCSAPTNLSYVITKSALVLSWKGTAKKYDLKVFDYQQNRWQDFPQLATKQFSITNLSEGVHDVYLRANCDGMTSEYVLFKPFYYHKGERCIDYLSLDDVNACKCFKGDYDDQHKTQYKPKFTDLLNGSIYNTSQASDPPLFSLHYMPDEYDPNTENKLLTKPADAIASVRLGRYDPTFGACTEYNYKVPDGDHAIMMLRYAIVLPNPHPGMDPPANPKFKLEIRAGGELLHDGCGEADFMSGTDGEWHVCIGLGGEVYWKDWTEMAVNLREYVGKTINVRLMTTGCSMSAHGGYAYYTLSCESGTLSGINCGDIPTTQFIGPSGFDYAWYLPNEPGIILGNDRIFNVDPMDTLVYNLDVISKTNSKCYYTLDATAVPRFPVPEATFTKEEDPCQNIVSFHQTCHVKYKNQLTEREWHTEMPVETIEWDFGDGTTLKTTNEYVSHTFPQEGGKYKVTLTAGIKEDLCRVSETYEINLPNIEKKPVLVQADICEGECYQFGGSYYCNTYIDTLNFQSEAGCDSMVIFRIIMHEKNWTLRDSICAGRPYEYDDTVYVHPGTYTHYYKNKFGCDSIVKLTLDSIPLLHIEYNDTFVICSGNRILDIAPRQISGEYSSMLVRFDEQSQQKGMLAQYRFAKGEPTLITIPDSIDPTHLHADVSFMPARCSQSDKEIMVDLRYPNSIFKLKDGLLGVMNANYNGGYTFDSIQWYRDNQKIPGAVYSVLSVTDADMGKEFTVELIRHSDPDHVRVRTCPIIYGMGKDPIIEFRDVNAAPYCVYTATGRKLGEWGTIDDIHGLDAGVYIIKDQQNHVYKIYK